jgi:hypothetical protein
LGNKKPYPSTEGLVVGGYIISITAGTLTFVIALTSSIAIHFGRSSTFPSWHRALDLLTLGSLEFVVCWLTAVVAAAPPCLFVATVAYVLKIRSWIFYLIAGVCVGILMDPMPLWVFDLFTWYTDPPGREDASWLQGLIRVAPLLGPAGGIGGLTFWQVARRYYVGLAAR